MSELNFAEEERIWGILTLAPPASLASSSGRFAPYANRQWRAVFRQWATEYAYSFSLVPHPKPDLPIVNHLPVKGGEDCAEVIFSIVDVIRTGGPIDLNDPILFTVWLDFLNDHEVRWSHWLNWTRNRGDFRYL